MYEYDIVGLEDKLGIFIKVAGRGSLPGNAVDLLTLGVKRFVL